MKKLISELSEIKGVKTARMQGEKLLRIEPHSRELKGQDAEKIVGELRKIPPKISSALDESDEIKQWEWNVRPKKRYKQNELDNSITDRKPKGHLPAHYLVTIEKD